MLKGVVYRSLGFLGRIDYGVDQRMLGLLLVLILKSKRSTAHELTERQTCLLGALGEPRTLGAC